MPEATFILHHPRVCAFVDRLLRHESEWKTPDGLTLEQAVDAVLEQHPALLTFLESPLAFSTAILGRDEPHGIIPQAVEYDRYASALCCDRLMDFYLKADQVFRLFEDCRLEHLIEIDEYHQRFRMTEGNMYHRFKRLKSLVSRVQKAEESSLEFNPD